MPFFLRLLRGLHRALTRGVVVLTTPKGDREGRLDSLVMIGSYLIARHGWLPGQLSAAIGADAEAKFLCSWSRTSTPESSRVLSVRDCWDGIDLAIQQRWFEVSCVGDGAELDAALERHTIMAVCYDAAWMVPGLVMVGADPVTVVADPNPAACRSLLPDAEPEEMTPCSTTSTCVGAASAYDSVKPVASSHGPCRVCPVDVVNKWYSENDEDMLPDAVSKEYNENYEDMLPSGGSQAPRDYASFLLQSRVGLIIRMNFVDELGISGNSYESDAFLPFGIPQVNLPVVDGGVPSPKDVATALELHESLGSLPGEGSAVLVHCKGGFGRSVVLAACLVIHHFDVPGSALLGWVRLLRPGAVTARKQELFLKRLRGERDATRCASIRAYSERSAKSGATSRSLCSLQ